MANATLRKVITGFSAQDPAVIDSLLNASGILDTALFEGASHNAWDVGKKVSSLPSGSFIQPGGSTTDQTVDDEIVQTDLKLMRSIQSEPIEIVNSYPGGKEAFFRNQSPAFLEGLGQTLAKQAIYGVNSTFGDESGFDGFHQIARRNGKVIQANGASGSRTTIFAVRWRPGVCSMLFNPNHMAAGEFIKFSYVNGGEPVMEVTNTTTAAKKLVYQGFYDSYSALKALDSKNIAAYTQIQDADNGRPTSDNMDLLLDYVNADPTNTFLYCNRTGRRMLNKLKDGKLEMIPAGNNYDRRVEAWNGIPIVLDENILSTETSVLD